MVEPRAYHLVLRQEPARAVRPLFAGGRQARVRHELVLRIARAPHPPRPPGAGDPAEQRRGLPVPRVGGRADRGAAPHRAGRGPRPPPLPRRHRRTARAAAPGAAGDRGQAHPGQQHPRAARGLSPRVRGRPPRRAGGELDPVRGGAPGVRQRRGGVVLGQRDAGPQGLARRLRADEPPGHQPRIPGVHGRRRLPQSPPLALERLGQGQGAGVDGAFLLGGGRERRRLEAVDPLRASAMSIRTSRSATSASTRRRPTPAGRGPASPPSASGSTPPASPASRAATSSTAAPSTPFPPGPDGSGLLQMGGISGSGPRTTTSPTRATSRSRGR